MATDRKFWLVSDVDVENDDEPLEYLADSPDGHLTAREVTPSELNGFEIAEYLDQKAEGENQHDFAGLHDAVHDFVRDVGGENVADPVMRKILRAGGLWNIV